MRQCVLVEGAFDDPTPLVASLLQAGFAQPTRVESVQAAMDTLRDRRVELLILPVRAIGVADRAGFETLLRESPSLAAIGTAPEVSAEVVLDSMRAGITEFLLVRPSTTEFSAALARLERRWEHATMRGSVIAVFCPKGGQGATTLAVNLAHALARRKPRRVSVVDLVVGMGDVALQLDLRPEYDIGELAQKVDRLDPEFVQSVAAAGPDSLAVLAATERLDLSPVLNGDVVSALLSWCRQIYEHTVVDTEHAFESRTVATLDAADTILLLAQLQVSSLLVAKRTLSIFHELGYTDDKVHIVINREGSTNIVSPAEAEKVLGRAIEARIPNDFAVASDAQARGVPFMRHAPGTALAKSYDALAARLMGTTLSTNASTSAASVSMNSTKKKSGFFGLIRK